MALASLVRTGLWQIQTLYNFVFSGINVLIQGKAKAGWDKDEAGDTVCYIAHEYFIKKTIQLFGG